MSATYETVEFPQPDSQVSNFRTRAERLRDKLSPRIAVTWAPLRSDYEAICKAIQERQQTAEQIIEAAGYISRFLRKELARGEKLLIQSPDGMMREVKIEFPNNRKPLPFTRK